MMIHNVNVHYTKFIKLLQSSINSFILYSIYVYHYVYHMFIHDRFIGKYQVINLFVATEFQDFSLNL